MDIPPSVHDLEQSLPGWSMGIRAIEPDDHEDITDFLGEHWGSPVIVSRGLRHDASRLPGYVAPSSIGDLSGLITLHMSPAGCEIVTMNSVYRGRGVGSRLMSCAEHYARKHGARRLWLVTTNDHTEAMAFYQRKGFRMVKVHRDAMEHARRLNPSIPRIGLHSIPITDEVEFEKVLVRLS